MIPGQISHADSKEHSHYASHRSHQRQNRFLFEIGIIEVLRAQKEITDSNGSRFWIAMVLDVSNRQEESFVQRLKVH